MITIQDKSITVSQGDTFTTLFQLNSNGYKLSGTETVYFGIKINLDDTTPILSVACGLDVLNNIISVYIPKTTMSTLLAGNYFYDIVLNNGDMRMSLLYSSPFIIKEVCHNV